VERAVILATIIDVAICSGLTAGLVGVCALARIVGWGRDVQR
jgi:ammonia channel protein AmtB